jgi:esterase/lipase
MKKIGIALLAILGLGTVTYLLGPKPATPTLAVPTLNLADSLQILEQQVQAFEAAEPGIRPDNQARIVWLDSTRKQKTKRVVLYIHGFSATQEEGDPVHQNLAKKFGANLYLARLAGHGVNLGDSTMQHLSSDDMVASAERALAIARKLGDEVVIVATSFGGALTLHLASKYPDLKAIVLYSPCVKVYDPNAELLDNPWGLELGKMVNGSYVRDFQPYNAQHKAYWSTHYHLDGVVALQNFLTHTMNAETFGRIKCPVFLGYWYKNEEEQDKVVSIPAMKEMMTQLGTPADQKTEVSFPEAGNHVLASYVLSKDYARVEGETVKFLEKIWK